MQSSANQLRGLQALRTALRQISPSAPSTRNPLHSGEKQDVAAKSPRLGTYFKPCYRHKWCLSQNSTLLLHSNVLQNGRNPWDCFRQPCQAFCSDSKPDDFQDQGADDRPVGSPLNARKKSGAYPKNVITPFKDLANDTEAKTTSKKKNFIVKDGVGADSRQPAVTGSRKLIYPDKLVNKIAHEIKGEGLKEARGDLKQQREMSSTSVSYTLEASVRELLDRWSMSYKEGYTTLITKCPKFPKRTTKGDQEAESLFINTKSGHFVCHGCKRIGSWKELKKNIELLGQKKKTKMKIGDCECDVGERVTDMGDCAASVLYESCIPVNDVDPDVFENILENLQIHHLTKETLCRFDVRVHPAKDGIVLPTYNYYMNLEGVRMVRFQQVESKGGSTKSLIYQSTVPRVDYNGMFGWNVVDQASKEVVLTANEFNAMAVHQELGRCALALPRRDVHLPQHALPRLEKFNHVTLWLGGDMNTLASARQLTKKLNETRCSLIRPDMSNPAPFLALKQGTSLKKIFRTSKKALHGSITSFSKLRGEVYMNLKGSGEGVGVKWARYPDLNKILKGHRRGELSVLTGPTGSGKTTFLSEYSLDLCMQGVSTLWGSFEISNTRLLRTMITQFAEVNLAENQEYFNRYADLFEQLPMHFMTFHGQEHIDRVLETMSHAVYIHDIAHIIIDNLQFMMGCDSASLSSDRFLKQDKIIGAVRNFATHNNCHVTLVIHPRKEREGEDLTINSIFGGAKASQEADNVFILQDRRLTSVKGRKYMQVVKNRYDGELGMFLLKFNKDSLSYSIPTKKPKKTKDTDDMGIGAMPISSQYSHFHQ